MFLRDSLDERIDYIEAIFFVYADKVTKLKQYEQNF